MCKSAPRPRQITMPASHHSVLTGQGPFLLPNQQCQSTEFNTGIIYKLNMIFSSMLPHPSVTCNLLSVFHCVYLLSFLPCTVSEILSDTGQKLRSHRVCNQATGYASQHIWCLSQARINWEGCVRKGIQHKNGGDGRGGGTNYSGCGGSPSGLLMLLPGLSSFCTRKSRRWQNVLSGTSSPRLSRTKSREP